MEMGKERLNCLLNKIMSARMAGASFLVIDLLVREYNTLKSKH